MPTADIKADDYYKVLGVDKGASEKEIAKAYKLLAMKHHPDKNPDNKAQAEENFKIISEAYEVLHDADKRKTYDQFGKQGLQGGGGGGPGGGVSFQHADEIFKAFFGGNDPFSMFFGDDDGGGFGGGGMRMGGMPGGTRVVFQGMPGGGGGGGMPGGFGFDMGGGMPGMMGGKGKGKGGGGGFPQQQAPPPPPHAMPVGTRVVVRDLAKAQEHNNKTGRISGWDASKSRYEVELEGETSLSLRPANLTQQCEVKVVGIASSPELNGSAASILGFQEAQGRYTVRLKQKMTNGKDVIGLQASNVILKKSTRVVVQGLGKEDLNGQMAQIVEIDEEAQRYTVACQNGKQIKIKYENVLC